MKEQSVILLALLVASSFARPSYNSSTLYSDYSLLSANTSIIHLYYLPITWDGNHPEYTYQSIDCDVPCSYASGLEEWIMSVADAVLFHLPMYDADPEYIMKQMGVRSQKLYSVAYSMEPSAYYPTQFDYVSNFDFEMSFRLSSDVPTIYFGYWMNLLKPVTDTPWEKREPAILFLASHCSSISGREKLVEMLQEHVRVDSLSQCMHNKDWPSDIDRSDKLAILRRYRVYLAAENSIEQDYVSEKVYDGLIAGAVPVYLGAPNIGKFVPENSVISVPKNFTREDIAKVAEVIKKIFTDKREYNKWISFKQKPYSDEFTKRFNFTNIDPKCRLCQRIFADRYGFKWDKSTQTICS